MRKSTRSFDDIENIIERYISKAIYKARNKKYALEFQKEILEMNCISFFETLLTLKEYPFNVVYHHYQINEPIEKYFFNEEYKTFWAPFVRCKTEIEGIENTSIKRKVAKKLLLKRKAKKSIIYNLIEKENRTPLQIGVHILLTQVLESHFFIYNRDSDEFPYEQIHIYAFKYIRNLQLLQLINKHIENDNFYNLQPEIKELGKKIQRLIEQYVNTEQPVKVRINEKYILTLYDVLKDWFDKKQHEELLQVLSSEKNASTPLIFGGGSNRFSFAFRIIYEKGLITNCNQTDLIEWIVLNFNFTYNKIPTPFKPNSILTIFTTSDLSQKPSVPLDLKIDDFILPNIPKSTKCIE